MRPTPADTSADTSPDAPADTPADTSPEPGEGRRLDPADWAAFADQLADLARACAARLEQARAHPWQPPPADMRQRLRPGRPAPQDSARVIARMLDEVLPFATGNTHPRFWGWVHGAGVPMGLAGELVAATMNANCGGRHHGAIAVEAALIDWLADLAGFAPTGEEERQERGQGPKPPKQPFGTLTTGTSEATILALSQARLAAFGPDLRRHGIAALPPVRVYAGEGVHACIGQALEIMGHGSDALRLVPAGPEGLDPTALARAVARDRAQGRRPLAVVATLGSVNTGHFDPLPALADFCAEQGLWLHADAAFGFWTRLADPPWRRLSDGLERADSIALDFHKWPGVPYAVAACLARDGALMRATFAARPDYLAPGAALAGGEVWPTDYGIALSRGFSALKVWAVVEAAGTRALGAAISDNCRQAALMGRLVTAHPRLRLAHPVISNICVFEPLGGDAEAIAAQLQMTGKAVFSTTRIGGVSCLRAAIVNHRTTSADIRAAIKAVTALL